MSGPRPKPEPHSAQDAASDVVRWAAFSCVLVPVVLLWYGTSPAGAAGTTVGLTAVTVACRYLLRRSERPLPPGTEPHGEPGTPHRAPRRAPHRAPRQTARGGGRHTRSGTPVD
ncbi:hypothetical protein AB0D30_24115 [Streptomyces sp. NPDC048409]|uniref:hypothetical protein n=1 Tax=Streptomyces sp. NPDC048409 TaxID=3154723 RepID=UPI00342ED616